MLAIQYTYDAATLIGLTQVGSPLLKQLLDKQTPPSVKQSHGQATHAVQGSLVAWEPQFWKRKVLLQSSGKLIPGEALLAVGQVRGGPPYCAVLEWRGYNRNYTKRRRRMLP